MKGLLKVGTAAPHWTLKTQAGKTLSLKELLGRGKSVVFYSYPKDDTPGCTIEACNFTRDYAKLQEKCTVVGISQDDVSSHLAFHTKFSLSFDLVADPEGSVLAQYGMGNMARITYVIDDLGIISHVRRRLSERMRTLRPRFGAARACPAELRRRLSERMRTLRPRFGAARACPAELTRVRVALEPLDRMA